MRGLDDVGAAPDPWDRRLLWLALACAFGVGAPWLFGHGVDLPDDALYFDLSSWEWFQLALRGGLNPFFLPGKLGGVSLFADVVPMGPFYPAIFTTAFLPAWIAMPWACVLHNVGMFLSVRWLARVLGASSGSATLAGAAVAVGPLGAMGFVDCRAAGWAGLLWFPVVFGALERLRQSESSAHRWRWTAVAAMAFALVLLGAHIRLSAAAGASLTLWLLMSGLPLRHGVAVLGLGLLGGLPTVLPTLMEWQTSAAAGSGLSDRLALLGSAQPLGFGATRLLGWLNPRPWVEYGDLGIGVVLGAVFLLTVGRGPLRWSRHGARPAARLGLWVAVLLLAFFTQALPGMRYLFAPLLVLTHPVNDYYSALALLPGAAVSAVALDWLLARDPAEVRSLLRGPRGVVVLALASLCLALPLGRGLLPAGASFAVYGGCLLQLFVGLGIGWWLLQGSSTEGGRRRRLLLALGLLDLVLVGARTHLSTPSERLALRDRVPSELSERLSGGYVDLHDLAWLEPFAYGPEANGPVEEDEGYWLEVVEWTQQDILSREVPVHASVALGLRGLGGVVKMPPYRQYQMLEPLARLTTEAAEGPEPAGARLAALFASEEALGSRTLALHGIPHVVGYGTTVTQVEGLAPRCFSASSTLLVEDDDERIRRLLSRPADPSRPALVESAPHAELRLARADVRCDEAGPIAVRGDGEAMVVLRERWHPGWTVTMDGEEELGLFPVNQVHMGMLVPAGAHQLEPRFVPPGLRLALILGGLAWLVIGGLLVSLGGRRVFVSPASADPAGLPRAPSPSGVH